MNIEELKLVIDTLKTVSGDASSAASVWIYLHYSTEILKGVFATVAIIGVALVIAKTVNKSLSATQSTNDWADAGRDVARAWGGDNYSRHSLYCKDDQAIAKAIAAGNATKTN